MVRVFYYIQLHHLSIVDTTNFKKVTLVSCSTFLMQKSVREMYDVLYHDSIPSCHSCGLSGGGRPNLFNILVDEPEVSEKGKMDLQDLRDNRGKVSNDKFTYCANLFFFSSCSLFV